MFWIVTWPISHRFRDKRRFPSKIANFSNPRVFPLELGIGLVPLKALIRPCMLRCQLWLGGRVVRVQDLREM